MKTIKLSEITSGEAELPRLATDMTYSLGYGFFEPQDNSNKPGIVTLAFNDNEEYVKLIDKCEWKIVELAASFSVANGFWLFCTIWQKTTRETAR